MLVRDAAVNVRLVAPSSVRLTLASIEIATASLGRRVVQSIDASNKGKHFECDDIAATWETAYKYGHLFARLAALSFALDRCN